MKVNIMGNIPIIGQVFKQDIVITVERSGNDAGNITMRFSPEMKEAITPEQKMAVNIVNIINATLAQNTETKGNV